MPRRLHVSTLHAGQINLEPAQAHHARDVLRLVAGDAVELFDDAGAVGPGVIARCSPEGVAVTVASIRPAQRAFAFVVASALPKGSRGDWMIEKLGELGAAAFIPLLTDRSIVIPQGKNKLERWQRLAEEAARQSRGIGVMRVAPPTPLSRVIAQTLPGGGWFFSTAGGATPIRTALAGSVPARLTLFIGPEGGWTDAEVAAFAAAGIGAVALTTTILRVETAALAAAAIVAALLGR
jgi:16S rRNA (uracil1498-N3)-methyltransferase